MLFFVHFRNNQAFSSVKQRSETWLPSLYFIRGYKAFSDGLKWLQNETKQLLYL